MESAQGKASLKRCRYNCLSIFFFSFLARSIRATDIPELIILDTRSSRPEIRIETIYFTQCVATWDAHTDLINQSVKFALLYALPLLFVSATYYQIVRVLWRSARFTVAAQPLQRQANNGQPQPTDEQQTRGEAILTAVEYFPFFFFLARIMVVSHSDLGG